MAKETDDYQSDARFGEWLRQQRTAAGLTLEAAAKIAAMNAERIKSLELGYSERGITMDEAKRLCSVYKIDLQDCLRRAENS